MNTWISEQKAKKIRFKNDFMWLDIEDYRKPGVLIAYFHVC